MLNNAYRRKLQRKMHKHKHKQRSASNTRMTILKTSFCLLLSSFSAFLQAADLPATPTTNTGGASEKINPTTANTDDSDKTQKAPVLVAPKAAIKDQKDVFKPSEEISEDFAVPFPVDI